MCRLFAMTSAPQRVRATFWLLDARDSLSEQSRRDPDGTGLGYFRPDGKPVLHKAPIAAYEDRAFAEEARDVESTTFIAHVRYATTGELSERNCHPFCADGRMLAHNGHIGDLDKLEAHLGATAMAQVHGDTDSERFFALVNRETRAAGGDVTAGLRSAARWVAAELPLFALNIVMTTDDQLWALRYPDTHSLYVLERRPGGHQAGRQSDQADDKARSQALDQAGAAGRLRVRADELADLPSVVVASEQLDDDPGWRPLRPGELLHVGPDQRVDSELALPDPPAHQLTEADLSPHDAASQKA